MDVYGFSLPWSIEQHRKHNVCLCIQILSLSSSPASSKPVLWTPDCTMEEQREGEGRDWYIFWKRSLPSRQKPNDTSTEQLSHEHILFGSFWESRVEAGAARRRSINSQHHDLLFAQIFNCSVMLAATWKSSKVWYTLKEVCSKANGDPREITHYSLSLTSVMHARWVLSRPSKFFLARGIWFPSRVYKLVAEHSHLLSKARCELQYSYLQCT